MIVPGMFVCSSFLISVCMFIVSKALLILSTTVLLDLRSGECDVVSLYDLCCSVNGSVCFVCCMFDSVCELFGETIRNMFGCVCYFVVECYGHVKCC